MFPGESDTYGLQALERAAGIESIGTHEASQFQRQLCANLGISLLQNPGMLQGSSQGPRDNTPHEAMAAQNSGNHPGSGNLPPDGDSDPQINSNYSSGGDAHRNDRGSAFNQDSDNNHNDSQNDGHSQRQGPMQSLPIFLPLFIRTILLSQDQNENPPADENSADGPRSNPQSESDPAAPTDSPGRYSIITISSRFPSSASRTPEAPIPDSGNAENPESGSAANPDSDGVPRGESIVDPNSSAPASHASRLHSDLFQDLQSRGLRHVSCGVRTTCLSLANNFLM